MTKQMNLVETTLAPAESGTRGLWRAVLLTPGKGSSGYWPEDVIRRDGPRVLRKGARCFVTHNREKNGEPNPFQMWGVLASDSYYDENADNGKGGLVADIQVLPSWIDRVEEVAPHTALSVFLMGESDEYDNIVEILEDKQNGVDLVVYPGREGSSLVEKLYESAFANSKKTPPAVSVEDTEETKGLVHMEQEIKDLTAAVTSLTADVKALVTEKAADVQANVDADALAAKVDEVVAEKVEAIKASVVAVESAKADLLPSQVKTLLESAFAGEDVTAAIESAKSITSEAKTVLAESANTPETGALGKTLTEGYVLGGFN